MSRRRGNTTKSFSLVPGNRANAFRSKVVRSRDGWAEYWLTPLGWYYAKSSYTDGVSSEGSKEVRQVLQETKLPDVIAFTRAALNDGWISESDRDKIRIQLDNAK